MKTDIILVEIIGNLTSTTTTKTLTNVYDNTSTQSMDNDDLKNILSYTIPLSCLSIIIVLLVIIGVRQRHCILNKLASLKRMRNTNLRFLRRRSVVLRRDSEFESNNDDHVEPTSVHQEDLLSKKQQYHLATIF